MIRYAVVSDSFCFYTSKRSGFISKDDVMNEYFKVIGVETVIAEFVSLRQAKNFLRSVYVSSSKIPRLYNLRGSFISSNIAFIQIRDYMNDSDYEIIDFADFKSADIVL